MTSVYALEDGTFACSNDVDDFLKSLVWLGVWKQISHFIGPNGGAKLVWLVVEPTQSTCIISPGWGENTNV